MEKKERLDTLLMEEGYFDSREKAKRAIMAGLVYVDNQRIDKAGTPIKRTSTILIKDTGCPYVSRGGLKLEKSLQHFNIDVSGRVVLDIGASTGGFTDCMLQKGALKSYAIDVGYGQLDYKLRVDPRVVVMEKTNIRYVDQSQFADEIGFITIDVSFISLKLVLPVAYEVLKDKGELVCLVKPQFEAGRQQVGKNGIIKDKKIHIEVLNSIIDFAKDLGFSVKGLTHSPIKGTKGNIEYLLYCAKESDSAEEVEVDIEACVHVAHHNLN
ncbi:MAG: TlyA family RNA methyltransferase [Peptostreptococcales bacterium]